MKMKMTASRFVCFTAALVLLLSGPAAAQDVLQGPAVGASAKSCELAQAWVEHNMDQLPRDYQQIIELPLPYRKAVYRNLTVNERLGLWQTQWERALDRSDLTEAQRDVLLEALQFTDRDFEALDAGSGWRYDRARRAVQDFEERAKEVFDRAELRRLFAQLGPVAAQKVWLLDHTAPSVNTPRQSGEACSCSQESDWCPDGYGCGDDSDGCDEIADDCGTFWTYNCDGECGRPFQD